jgi:hypothetical protein
MNRNRLLIVVPFLLVSNLAFAQLGSARVSNVVPLDGGCVLADSLPLNAVESWDVEQTKTYAVTLTQLTDCANGGTDASIQVVVKSSNTGNMCLTASKVATGTYTFSVTLPGSACHTYPITYCTSGCSGGFTARRSDGGNKASHLRAATFGAGCSAPTTDTDCTLGCSPLVSNIGGGCGAPAPGLHSTMEIVGQEALISVIGAPIGVPVYLAANGVPFPPSVALGGGCVLHIDPATATIVGPFNTSSQGDFYLSVMVPPAAPFLSFRIQGAVVAGGGPFPGFFLTNGLETRFGSCAAFCTYSPAAFTGAGAAAMTYDDNFETVFAAGLTVGIYDLGSGAAAPNGLQWTGDAAGRAALETFLALPAAPSGPLTSDAINPIGTNGGGSLAIHAAALALNIGFNAAGVLGGQSTNFGSLLYIKMNTPDSLSGLTLVQILAIAQQALAGNGLPVGYSYDSLAAILELINGSFESCTMSEWSSHRLYY